MNTCKLCEKNPVQGRFKYCEECKRKYKKPRDAYYHKKRSQDDSYKEDKLQRAKQWINDNPEQHLKYRQKRQAKLKKEALTYYSESHIPRCNSCGNSNLNVLALDHINNNGAKERSLSCYNCNWKKHLKNLRSKPSTNPKREYQYHHNLNLKKQCISHYSQNTCKCSKCGENDLEVLCLDHINNDGSIHRKQENISGGKAMYKWAIKNDFPPLFQVLCLNCNIEKQRTL
jgi:hypothetical protein